MNNKNVVCLKMDYYPTINKRKIMKFIVKRLELETIIVTHIWKEKCHVFSHFWMLALNPAGYGYDWPG